MLRTIRVRSNQGVKSNIRLPLDANYNHSKAKSSLVLGVVKDKLTRCRSGWWFLSYHSPAVLKFIISLVLSFIILAMNDTLFCHYGHPDEKSIANPESVFSVVINTYKRESALVEAVRHYADTCGRRIGVHRIYIVWAEDKDPPDPSLFFYGNLKANDRNRASVEILRVPDSLNSRFLPIGGLPSKAIFMVDDDVIVDCSSLQQGFEAWNSNPSAPVGYYPRFAAPPLGLTAETGGLIAHMWPVVFYRQKVNYLLTKACFLHSRYFHLYSGKQHPQEIKDYVDKYMNCEDIAMSLLIANSTRTTHGRPTVPVFVEGHISDKGLFTGISVSTGYVDRRAACLTDLTHIYENFGWGSPLGYEYTLQEVAWKKHAPGFWFQFRPSNPSEWLGLSDVFR